MGRTLWRAARARSRRSWMLVALTMAVMMPASMLAPPAAAAPAGVAVPPSQRLHRPAAPPAATDPSTVRPDQRDRVLPAGWRTSTDLAWTTAGDATGFHLLVAESSTGYTWRTAATLREPGLETDRWIGNACLTASGKRAVVVYAPRHFTNRQHLFGRGAFAAVVELATGKVTKLGLGVSLAYYNPGCGAAETAVLTQSGAADLGRTRLHLLDAAKGTVVRRHELAGQVTSAVPFGDRIAAATGGRLVAVGADGTQKTLARTHGVAYELRPDRDGGIAFLERHGDTTASARYLSGRGAVRELGSGPLAQVGLAAGASGRVFLKGVPAGAKLPATVRRVAAPARADVSTLGQVVVTHLSPDRAAARGRNPLRPAGDPGVAKPVDLQATVPATGQTLRFSANPTARTSRLTVQGRMPAPLPGTQRARSGARATPRATAPRPDGTARALASDPSTDPVDADRTCSVPRNDVRSQVEQPHWRQVEWAADLAVQGALTVQRPANWNQSGLPAWSPQGMFPKVELSTGGRVPAQILLGILAQESNLWQASPHVLEGVTGNPLVGNFYGTDETNDPWAIHWSEADCGYGVAQVTDGMVKAGKERDRDAPALPADKQRAVALDYATNIAAGLQILARKWNQLQAAGITINDNDPSKLENWFAAVWAYNTGVNPQAITGNTRGCTPSPSCTDAPGNGPGGNWGLGWGNNPANPDYPPDRHPFLVDDQEDARHPQDWSYPEKVMGFAASPIVKYDFRTDTYEGAYLQGWWISVIARDTGVRPPLETFCRSGPDGNNCVFDDVGDRASCALGNFHCWWHWPATWKADCQQFCGHENLRYGPGAPEPPDGTHYPPVCDGAGLPGGSLIVDDQPDTVPIVRTPCGGTQSHGTFKLQFVATGQPGPLLYPGKVDLHQIGSGLDGHFWFTHAWTRQDADLTSLEVRGTWALDHDLNQWARVWVHLPSHGAHSQQATYVVDRGSNASPAATQFKRRTLLQNVQQNKWVPLGVFQFAGRPKVTLTNVTRNDSAHPEKQADGTEDVAYDAVAFQPLTAKPRNFVVSLGDSYSSGEGASEDEAVDYDTETNTNGGDSLQNGCHRSRNSWARRGVLGDNSSQTIGQRESTGDANLDFHLIACSGAQTENLLPTTGNDPATNQPWRNEWGELGTGAYREGAQLDRGYLDENTTLVTFSIGGNDLKWGDAIRDCVLTPYLYPCWEASIDGERAADYVPRLMHQKYPPSLLTVLRAIKQQAPNAKILVMGYPELISDGGSCLRADPDPGHPAGYLDMSVEEAEWSNQLARDLAVTEGDTIALARDQGINVRFADPILNRDFYGEDGGGESVCGDPETIHGIIWAHTKGEKPGALPSKQSFHPKVSGTANYAKTYNRELRNWGL